jgi:Gpi18-like mannosyltransferase
MFLKKRPLLLVAFVLFCVSIFIRYRIRGSNNFDLFLIGNWYRHLFENGWNGLADADFSNYPPAYLYLLWFSTLFSKWFGPLVSIKIIPTFFDLISVFFIFLIARLRFKGDEPYVFASLFFILPTIIVNSSGWGQIDSLYTSFLLGCVYFLLREKPFWALLAFGVSFSFKAQAIFLLPFLGLMFLKGLISWFHFFLVPSVYLALGIPAVLIGRSWGSIIYLYAGQVEQFEELSKTAPNLYFFIPNTYYHPVLEIGLLVFVVAMICWAWLVWKSKNVLTQDKIMFTALVSLALVPFLLPKMHDRYFYPADAFSFAVAIFNPEMWFLPVLYQVISGLSYTLFLFKMPVYYVKIAAVINTVTVVYILQKYLFSFRRKNDYKQ